MLAKKNLRYAVIVFTVLATFQAYAQQAPKLTSLISSKGFLSPAFATNTFSYTLTLPLGATSVRFTASADQGGHPSVNKVFLQNGVQSDSIAVQNGDTLKVAASLGEASTLYTLVVKLERYPAGISFEQLAVKTYGQEPFTPITNRENTAVPIQFASSDTLVAKIIDGKINILKNGTASITAWQLAGNGYGPSDTIARTLTVNKAELLVQPRLKTRAYGAQNGTIFFNYTGFVNGDNTTKLTAGLPVATVEADVKSPVGEYNIAVTVKQPEDYYILSPMSGTLVVEKAMLTVTPNPANRKYGADDPVVTFNYSGFVNGETVSKISTKPVADIAAEKYSLPGKYAMTGTGALAANYDFTYLPGVFTVERAFLTITPKNKTITYGTPIPALNFTYTGLASGESASEALTTLPVAVTTATTESPSGNYPITASGATSGKYMISYAPGTLTVNRAPLQAIARNQTRERYQSNPALAVRYVGFVNGDTEASLTRAPQAATLANEASAVGKYPITVSNGYSPYYTFTYTAGTLTVTQSSVSPLSSPAARTTSSLDEPAGDSANDIVAHSAISPNGDGQNDFWQIDNIEKYVNNKVSVLTSAGALVYETSGYNNSNNRFEGFSSAGKIKQQPGTYLYVINYAINGDLKKKTGYLVLK